MIIRSAIVLFMGMMAAPVYADIVSATYSDPTDRYKHAVLGDAIEYGSLIVKTPTDTHKFQLPTDHVFEDTQPRLADVDADGAPEVIVIETDVHRGAALAIYDETGKIAETPHIGTSNRWLAPIGVADFNGDGAIDIAYIDRPHLAKTLRIVSYKDGKLTEIANKQGFSNHKIGWDFIASGVRNCGAVPEMILARGDWSEVVSVTLTDSQIKSRSFTPYVKPKSILSALNCQD